MTQRYPDFIWHNGEIKRWQDATVHVMAHGLHYGSSVFEGIRCYETANGHAIFRLTEHNRRLFASAKIYEMPIPYTLEQIVPLALLSADPLAFCVQTENPIKTVKELVAAAKAKQGAMSFSSSGPYGITHVPAAMFLDAAGIKMRHVPTTGGGPAVIQLLGGHVDMHDGGLAAVFPHIKSGKLRPLCLTDVKRSTSLPEVPTMKEAGYDVEAYLWVGLFTTAGVPEPVMTKLRDIIKKSVADPLFHDAMTKSQVVIDYRDAPEFRKFFDADYKRLAVAVKAIGRLEEHK